MQATPTLIADVLIFEPRLFGDARGFFMESFNQQAFDAALGHEVRFVQDNHSRSARGVLRGLHYQLPPHAQGKLVRVTQGAAFDVAVDIRRGSPTFGQWLGVELTADSYRMLFVPGRFAHGFLTLENNTDVCYQVSAKYTPGAERGLRWDDPAIGIHWPFEPVLISEKDRAHPDFQGLEVPVKELVTN